MVNYYKRRDRSLNRLDKELLSDNELSFIGGSAKARPMPDAQRDYGTQKPRSTGKSPYYRGKPDRNIADEYRYEYEPADESGDAYDSDEIDTITDGNDNNGGSDSDNGDSANTDNPNEGQDDIDASLEDFYSRLYGSLKRYGVTGIPALDELYDMLEAFLRPAIDAAIANRQSQGETNMAELDADAYARGMGGSSFLSSMKSREYDAVEDDIMGLEGKYSNTLAEYLYKAVTQMQDLEQRLAATLRSSGSGRASGGSASGKSQATPYGRANNGAYFDGTYYEGDFSYLDSNITYEGYCEYLDSFSAHERYLLFTSNRREWRSLRWQLQYNLPYVDYKELYETYFAELSGGGSAGGANWVNELY